MNTCWFCEIRFYGAHAHFALPVMFGSLIPSVVKHIDELLFSLKRSEVCMTCHDLHRKSETLHVNNVLMEEIHWRAKESFQYV